MHDFDVNRDSRVLRVRDAGEVGGPVVMYFHGTPGSRLDLRFGEQLAAARGVRLVCFDRPGYGGSTPAPFGLAAVAADAVAIADALGVDRFATLGMSGGGPGALATAAVAATRVTRVGVASGVGPFQLVPGALDALDENDRKAVLMLPGEPDAAAAAFAAGFGPLVELFQAAETSQIWSVFAAGLSPHDLELMRDEQYVTAFVDSMREALRPGTSGGAWDNVSWLGPWDIDLGAVRCPVLLWYGGDDRMAPPAHGQWLADNLVDAHLVVRDGEGHLGLLEHLGEVLDSLTAPSANS